MVIGKFNNKCKTQFSNDVGSISTLLKLWASEQIEFLHIYLAVKSRSKQPKEGRLSSVLEYVCRYFHNLLSTMTLKVLWIYLLVLPLIVCMYACLSPWEVYWTWRLPRALGFASDFQSSGNNVSQSSGSRARHFSLLSFQGAFPDQLETGQQRWPVAQVNQRPSVTVGLAGGLITNLSVLISLVMWQLPKKETRKSCVTKGETWRRAADHWAWQSSLAGGGDGQRRALATCPRCPRPDLLEWGCCKVSHGQNWWHCGLQAGRGPPQVLRVALRWWQLQEAPLPPPGHPILTLHTLDPPSQRLKGIQGRQVPMKA